MEPDAAKPEPHLGLWQIFSTFTKISLTSFGGGLSGWMMREFVQNKRWLTEKEFLTGLALAQAFPGVNVVNLSIWVGYRLRGGAGALAGAFGMVVPAMVVAVCLVAVFDQLARFPLTHVILAGVAAAAIGLSLQMGIRAARRAVGSLVSAAVMTATFLAIFVFGFPLLPVVAVMAPISVAAAAYRLKNAG
ncbi:chromate transporter [Telmatospirillum siberiense]|uniref:Chromate transporter n=1 Tax=Telmatospirillum siberiense TaxID=382514 RepID=A0A2N3PVY5_9PROT|nr:chromate transporter [Telmatospirillum siberiense]PKU24548.1 chromate transporter [Telmatospirillum siberiense]